MIARLTTTLHETSIVTLVEIDEDPSKNTQITMEYEEQIPMDRLGVTQALTAIAREVALQIAK